MRDDDKAEGEGFVIKDSRSSQLSEEEAETHDTKESTSPTDTGKENQPQEPFQIDFSTFIMSLTSSAFYHLGDIADPETGKTETNLPAVHQTIDMLTMLREKTKNNLTDYEEQMLINTVSELKLNLVAKTKNADQQQ